MADTPAGRGRPAHPRTPATHSETPLAPLEGERLQKFLAHAGVASRRHAEELILAGDVTVNGKTVQELGTRVMPADDAA